MDFQTVLSMKHKVGSIFVALETMGVQESEPVIFSLFDERDCPQQYRKDGPCPPACYSALSLNMMTCHLKLQVIVNRIQWMQLQGTGRQQKFLSNQL